MTATACEPAARAGGDRARIAAVLGHELRNPLAAALAGASLAGEMVDPDDPRRAVLDRVVAELERMSRLIDGYLGLARAGVAARQPVAVAPLLAAVAARGGARVRAAAVGAPDVLGDPALLERALENLVENALQAGARTVRLGAERRGDRVRLLVDDDGPGIPAELRQRVFEPGFSRSGGTGLGLCIVAETVAAHGGAVRNEPRPNGSRFVVELPAPAAAEAR